MSLRIWLPLTKDLRNQGLDDITITNSGATYSATGGKLGGCYVFDGSDDSIGIGNLSTLVNTDFTFACWFYHDNTWSSKGYETLLGGPSGFELESKVSTTNSPVLKLYNWGGGSCIYELNKWNHVVFTRNTTETKLYLNGELQVTGTAGTIPSGDYFIGAWKTSAQQNFKGNMNDVRIYDHCLSPMEVKELAKGLVLHYPLDRQGWGQENLATNTSFSNSNIEGYGGQKAIEYNHSDWTSGGRYFAGDSNSRLTFTEIQANQPYTISAWVYIYSDVTLSNPGGTTVFYRIYKTGDSPNYGYDIYFDLSGITERNKWIKVSKTFVSSYTYTYNQGGTFQIGGYNGHFKVSMPKVEKGSIATPWCPNKNDALYSSMGMDDGIEYDCSGFCNNGTRTGTFNWTSDTPKYSVSQYFDNPTETGTLSDKIYISASPNLYSPSAITVGFWFKKEAITRGGLFTTGLATMTTTTLAIHDYDSNIKVISSDNTTLSMGSYDTFIPSTNIWYYYVITFDGINAKIYINGDLKTTKSYGEIKTLQNIINITLGANSAGGVYRSVKGHYSDFRVYATALSASDVQSLYQNSAYIDSSGNVYGAVHMEA